MKHIVKTSAMALTAFAFLSSVLHAETYTVNVTGSGNGSSKYWSNSEALNTTSAWTDSSGTLMGFDTYAPAGSDIIYTVGNNNNSIIYDISDSSYYINNYTASSGNNYSISLQYDMRIMGNITYSSNNNNARSTSISTTNGSSLYVGGNVTATDTHATAINYAIFGGDTALGSLNIVGNMTFTKYDIRINVAGKAEIQGLVTMNSYGTNDAAGKISLVNTKNGGAGNRAVYMGALQSSSDSAVKGGLYVALSGTAVKNGYLTFTGYTDTDNSNNKSFTYYGNVKDGLGQETDPDTRNGSLIHVIMAASDSASMQTLAGENDFTGKTILTKGKLKFAASTTKMGDIYLGYTADRAPTTYLVTGQTAIPMTANDGKGAETSLIFDGTGATAANFNWSSGILGMILSDADKGTAVLELTGAMVLGGADYFTFDFNAGLSDGTYALVSTQSDLSAFIDKFKSNYGDGADHFSYANGILSLTVGVIPEPASYAAIFGALALAFAAYKRRK